MSELTIVRAGYVSSPGSSAIAISSAGVFPPNTVDMVRIKLAGKLAAVKVTRRKSDLSTQAFLTVNKSTVVIVE